MMNDDSEQAQQQQQQQVTFAEGVTAAAAPQDLITPTNGSTTSSMASSTAANLHKKKSALSVVSKQYDRTNKGYLDETEQAMRQLDESGRGHVPNHVVYDLMQESVTMHKKMATQGCFTVILALANMATAFAAASLAKVCIVHLSICAVTIFYFSLCVETYVLCWND